MKKVLCFVLSLVMAVACLSACDEHEHTFADTWSHDAENHWHAATCEHEEKKDIGEHVFDGNVCTVCGYDKTPAHTHEWTYKYDDEYHWQECSCSERQNRAAHVLNGYSCTVCDYEAPKPPFTAAMLASVQGPLSLAGTSLFWEQRVGASERNNLPSSMRTIFTEDTFYQYEINEKKEWELSLYKNADGDPVLYLFDPLRNEYNEQRYGKDEDDDGTIDEYYEWSRYENPFDSLTVENFTPTNTPGEYELDKNLGSQVGDAISGWWDETITSFIVTVKDDAIVSMKFGTEIEVRESDNYGEYFRQATYSMNVVKQGDAVDPLDVPQPYPTEAGQEKLTAALNQLLNTSFTVKQTDVDDSDIFDEGGQVETHYVTEDAIYIEFTDDTYDTYGWIPGDGSALKFQYKDGEVSEFPTYPGLDDEQPPFEELLPSVDFAAAVFEQKADNENVFVARTAAIAAAVTPILYPIGSFRYQAITLEITLGTDGKIATIVYDYEIGSLPGTITLEFSDYGTTEIPIDLSSLTGGSQGGGDISSDLSDEAFGVFETTTPDVAITKIELTKTSLTINDTTVVDFSFETDDYDSIELVFTYNGVEYRGGFIEGIPGDPVSWWIHDADYNFSEWMNKTSS